MMGSFFGEIWLYGSEIDVKFLAPVRPGDCITTKGVVKEKIERDSDTVVIIEVACVNQDGGNTFLQQYLKLILGTIYAVLFLKKER